MICLLDYVHTDDTFLTNHNSGLDAVNIIGIDEKARARRHIEEIRANIKRSKTTETKETL
jgi:hypothetical protein